MKHRGDTSDITDGDTTDHGAIRITRDIDVDVTEAGLWSMIGDGGHWAEWMVDDGALDVRPGGSGTVTDGGRERDVRVEAVEPGRVVRFVWWPRDGAGGRSSVELIVVPHGERAVLRVVETFPPSEIVAACIAAAAWDVRTVTAWSCARSLSPALG